MQLRASDTADFNEALVAEPADGFRFTRVRLARDKHNCEEQCGEGAKNHAAKTTPAIAAITTAPTRETSTSNVTKRRTPVFMDVLYVAQMATWFATDTARLPIAIGTLLWAIAALVIVIVSGPTIWFWVCIVGLASGIGGMIYLRSRARRPGIRYE